jgi:biotin carboxyl carrier protein
MAHYLVTIDGQETEVTVEYRSEKYFATVGQHTFEVQRSALDDWRSLLLIDGNSLEFDIRPNDSDSSRQVFVVGTEIHAEVEDYNLAKLRQTAGMSSAGAVDKVLKAPMPGLILELRIEPGQSVSKGDPLLIVEAMKMENVMKSQSDGTVKDIYVSKGQSVEKGDKLLEIE